MKTEKGDIVFALYPERAPVTTANFLAYVDGGLYDGAAFYRTTRPDNDPMIEVIQGGLWAPWREGEEGYAFAAPLPDIAHETTATTGLSHTGGTLSMARDAPGTASSEIFVTIGDNTALDYGGARNPDGQGFAAFGKVVDGMDVVRAIQAGATDASLDGAVLYLARLEGAELSGATGLVQQQLDEACGDQTTRLPGGLAMPQHWPCPPPPEEEDDDD